MLKYAKTEDEIGCILGHEMAHNLARHQGEKISSNIVVSLFGYLSLLVDPSGKFLDDIHACNKAAERSTKFETYGE